VVPGPDSGLTETFEVAAGSVAGEYVQTVILSPRL